MIWTSRCKTQYLANILPYQWQLFLYELGRLRSGIIFLDKETFYQLKLLTLWPVEIESTHFVWKTNSLPLTYGHFFFILQLYFSDIYISLKYLFYNWLYISEFLFNSILLNKAKYIFYSSYFYLCKNFIFC